MSRTRTYGIVATLAASLALVAGCGGGSGQLAAESAPDPAAGTAASAADGTQQAAPATPGAEAASQIGVFTPTDDAINGGTFASYSTFPEKRAGTIFVDPTVKAEAPASTGTTPASPGTVTDVPLSPTTPAPTTPTSPTTPTPAPVTTKMVASLDISGQVQTVKVGDQVPPTAPMFTVQAITTEKVTLEVLTGTLPGGGKTQDILNGQSITLTDPTTSMSYTIKVVEIKAEV